MAFDTSAYDKFKKQYNASVDKNTTEQINQAKEDASSQLKQAYLKKAQDQMALNKSLAISGIRGGTTETANLGLMTNYGNQRGAINSNLNTTIRDINTTAEANKLNYAQEIDMAKQQAKESYDAEQRAWKREDEQRKYEQTQQNLTAKYGKYYSIPELKKALKNASTPQERQVINARIAYLKQHKRGY